MLNDHSFVSWKIRSRQKDFEMRDWMKYLLNKYLIHLQIVKHWNRSYLFKLNERLLRNVGIFFLFSISLYPSFHVLTSSLTTLAKVSMNQSEVDVMVGLLGRCREERATMPPSVLALQVLASTF